jgi:hypothetical protein
MSFIEVIKTIFEFSLVAFTLWAVLNESRFIKIERKIKAFFRRRKIKAVKGNSVVCRNTF